MIKKFKQFNENVKFVLETDNYTTTKKETISTKSFIKEFQRMGGDIVEEFNETIEEESIAYAVNTYIIDDLIATDDDNPFSGNDKFVDCKYEHVKSFTKKLDGKDEELMSAVFRRKKDGKLFKLSVHDAGFIGPSTLTLDDKLYEVEMTKTK